MDVNVPLLGQTAPVRNDVKLSFTMPAPNGKDLIIVTLPVPIGALTAKVATMAGTADLQRFQQQLNGAVNEMLRQYVLGMAPDEEVSGAPGAAAG